ncbi:MAG TPA: hypothetical protein VER76_09900, partial [Pyrinomonadaceae bacterium]|nr:hypothetical protein [Pyrinomonadaceae bacterium]
MIEVDDTKSGANDVAAERHARGAESEAATRDGATSGASDAQEDGAAATPRARPLVLHRSVRVGSKDQYHVDELLQYHDRQFIEQVYRAILRRSPSPPEAARELDELRGGRASKVEIIERVWSSAEAQAGGAGR